MALPQEILDAVEELVEEKFNSLIAAHKLNPDVISGDIKTFEDDQMLSLSGDEPISQGFFRRFLAWMSTYLDTLVTNFQTIAFDNVKYITPVDIAEAPDCGKLIAPFACLILEGEGVEPTIPAEGVTPNDALWDHTSDLMIGGFAYNKTDNKWFYRGESQIYELKESLSLTIADVDQLTEALGGLEPKQAGKSLSENDLTDALVTDIGNAASHIATENIHLPPDGISIQQSDDDALEIIASYIIGLFSATLPLAIDVNGNITLAIDETTLDIVDGKLTVIAVPSGTLLSFDEGTGVLAVDALGTETVDLSSLSVPGGTVDLSNCVKKTGEASQTIEGDLIVTGECEAFG